MPMFNVPSQVSESAVSLSPVGQLQVQLPSVLVQMSEQPLVELMLVELHSSISEGGGGGGE